MSSVGKEESEDEVVVLQEIRTCDAGSGNNESTEIPLQEERVLVSEKSYEDDCEDGEIVVLQDIPPSSSQKNEISEEVIVLQDVLPTPSQNTGSILEIFMNQDIPPPSQSSQTSQACPSQPEVSSDAQEAEQEEGEVDAEKEEGAESCNFIVIDEIGECREDEPEVIFSKDASDLFCLDTTPEIAKERPLGPRFRRVSPVFILVYCIFQWP